MYPIEWFSYTDVDFGRLFLIKYFDVESQDQKYALVKYYRNSFGKDIFKFVCDKYYNYQYLTINQILEFIPVDEIDKLLNEHENMYDVVSTVFTLIQQAQIELEKV